MASADLLRIEEFYSSLFDSAKGDGVGSHSQLIERKIEALKDMATKGPKISKAVSMAQSSLILQRRPCMPT